MNYGTTFFVCATALNKFAILIEGSSMGANRHIALMPTNDKEAYC